ncbi:ankyrin repeat-containing domain protein [Clohesyomyces aquaticus]|uniref:Ankyrin repeat-containing domain protein n=1 Tax=Clohesyomyces aquaticus TaxID=1231657 RepID=A0A1Y1ZP33_9PLEO|nr:ankyrin repeat-containing domain protein [Clohesyomyces aquaticus]
MAEVIGVLASVATLTETAAKLSRLIRSMKKAPDEILALNNEVTDLTILLTRIKDTQAEHPHSLAHILPTLRNLEKSIASLKEVVTRFDGRGTSGLRRFKWTTERDKINRLKEDLRERRVQLDMLLAMTNFWFVRKAFTFSFSVSRLGDPTLTITARNILPSYSEPFLAIERGDTLRILEMLRERSLHPNSIDGVFGRTLLHAAVVSYQVEICELLIQAGADPTLESKPGSSAADQAWDFIFSAPQPDQILKDLARPFARYGDPDSRQLTTLHRLVLGLTSGDVRERTGIAASEIEVPDVWGRTSLWWACRRGDLKATVTLLAQGANPNVDDKEGITPLLAALSSYSSKGYSHSALLLIFQNLLQYGANLNARSKHGWGAAHFASRCEGTGFLELFLSREPNLDIKSGDTNGMTPLHCATSAGNVAVANFLILQRHATTQP